MSREKILIVEDEKEIAELIQDYLKDEGYDTMTAYDGEQGMQYYHQFKPDLVVLDIMLPKMEGTELCRVIRGKSTIPIIMLSAKRTDLDKILSLGLGADDYITKPFSPGELVARVKAQLRRYVHLSSPKGESDVLIFGDLQIYVKNYQVTVSGKSIPLSAKEFEVLSLLAGSPGQVFSREQIFNMVWGFNEFGDINTVTVHIKKIREKLEQNPSKPEYVKTVWGVGYKFEGCPS